MGEGGKKLAVLGTPRSTISGKDFSPSGESLSHSVFTSQPWYMCLDHRVHSSPSAPSVFRSQPKSLVLFCDYYFVGKKKKRVVDIPIKNAIFSTIYALIQSFLKVTTIVGE